MRCRCDAGQSTFHRRHGQRRVAPVRDPRNSTRSKVEVCGADSHRPARRHGHRSIIAQNESIRSSGTGKRRGEILINHRDIRPKWNGITSPVFGRQVVCAGPGWTSVIFSLRGGRASSGKEPDRENGENSEDGEHFHFWSLSLRHGGCATDTSGRAATCDEKIHGRLCMSIRIGVF